MSSPLALEALRIARTQIGVRERPPGSNDGPEIKSYLLSAGLTKPNTWCMSFNYWCFEQASHNLKMINPLYRTGSVMQEWANRIPFRQFGSLIAQPGDIFILDHGHGLGHAGIVDHWDPYKLVYFTVEGNSNNNGSRDGEAVVSHTRKKNEPMLAGYLRF